MDTETEKRELARLRWRKWYAKPGNAERNRENVRRWNEANKDRKNVWRKEWQAAPNGQLYQYRRRLARYGLTLERHTDLLIHQADRCAGCGVDIAETHNIDHDHATGAVRGLLCRRCNHALGHARDNPDILRALASYLDTPPNQVLDELQGVTP